MADLTPQQQQEIADFRARAAVEELEAAKALAAIKDRMRASDQAMSTLTKQNSKDTLKTLQQEYDQAKKILDAKGKGSLGYIADLKVLKQIEEKIKTVKKVDEERSGVAALKRAGEATKSSLTIFEDFGSILKSTAWGAVAVFALAQIDIQRRLSGLSEGAAKLFGGMGSKGADNFGKQFIQQLSYYPHLITSELRGQFLKATMDIGLSTKGMTGDEFAIMADRLMVLGQTFNVSTSEIVNSLFTFRDVLGESTETAGKDIEKLANTALDLNVAPAKLIKTTTDLVSTYKLQKIGLEDVTKTFISFRNNAALGVQVTEQLTHNITSSLAGMKEGKIAALLSLTSGKGGMALGNQLVEFFKIGGKTTTNRLDLAIDSFKMLEKRFITGTANADNQWARSHLAMMAFGVQDMETGANLLTALDNAAKQGKSQKDAVNEAKDLLTKQTGSLTMINNIIQNLLGKLVATLLPFLEDAWQFMAETSKSGKIKGFAAATAVDLATFGVTVPAHMTSIVRDLFSPKKRAEETKRETSSLKLLTSANEKMAAAKKAKDETEKENLEKQAKGLYDLANEVLYGKPKEEGYVKKNTEHFTASLHDRVKKNTQLVTDTVKKIDKEKSITPPPPIKPFVEKSLSRSNEPIEVVVRFQGEAAKTLQQINQATKRASIQHAAQK